MKEKYLNIEIDFKDFWKLLEAETKKAHHDNESPNEKNNHNTGSKEYFLNIDYDKIGDEIKHYSASIKKFHNYTTEGKSNKSTTAEHFFRGALCDKSV